MGKLLFFGVCFQINKKIGCFFSIKQTSLAYGLVSPSTSWKKKTRKGLSVLECLCGYELFMLLFIAMASDCCISSARFEVIWTKLNSSFVNGRRRRPSLWNRRELVHPSFYHLWTNLQKFKNLRGHVLQIYIFWMIWTVFLNLICSSNQICSSFTFSSCSVGLSLLLIVKLSDLYFLDLIAFYWTVNSLWGVQRLPSRL